MEPCEGVDQTLERYFGFTNFRSGQREALGHVLAGADTLVVMPTGHGKSLIYQLAALLLPGTSLVISPLISLMKDQVDSLARRDIPATFINSSLNTAQQNQRLREVAAGNYKILFVAPERLRSQPFRAALGRTTLSLLVVDEAHCLSQWGHDFRPDYLHIAAVRRSLGVPVTLALTATATGKVQDDIIELLGLSGAKRLVTGFNRPNLSLEVLSAPDVRSKYEYLHAFLDDLEGAGIIYAGTRRDTEEIADFIQEVHSLPVRYYHAGLEPEIRTEVQDAFMAGDLPLVAATNAFGMGIDRPDVRFVLHYTMPGSLEAYYQEAGRAGRDGLPARAVLIYSPKDTALHEYFIETAAPSIEELRTVHSFLVSLQAQSLPDGSGAITFQRDDLTRSTGFPEVKARVALEQLEVAQALTRDPVEIRNFIRIVPHPLSTQAIQRITAQSQILRRHRLAMLEKMVDYAETNNCRRKIILNHFGDAGPAEASLCCDNCLSREAVAANGIRPAESQSERAVLIALDAIQQLRWGLGKSKIARILKGSSGKKVAGYTKHRHYAKLAAYKVGEIEALIDQLLRAGYIKAVGSDQPVLALTSLGEATLKSRAAVNVQLRSVRPGAGRRLQAEREAGGTLSLTGQMLANGFSPEQIAAERDLSVNTIYSHLARLIAAGKVQLDSVVPQEKQVLIRAAIKALGSTGQLAPIKARLPEDIDYNIIRCVVEDWNREHKCADAEVIEKKTCAFSPELFDRLRAWRIEKAREIKKPAYVVFSDKALHGIASTFPKTTADLVLIHGIGSAKANQFGAEVLAIVQEINKIRRAARLTAGSQDHLAGDPVKSFLSRPHPRQLKGPWLAGWALDFHSRFAGDELIRGVIGDLVFRYKYGGERDLVGELAGYWADLLAEHPEISDLHAVVPVPPSARRDFDPVSHLAQALAARLGIPASLATLVKSRQTRPQKELNSLSAKLANVAGAFALRGSVADQNLLLVDDLYDSGATLNEATRTLNQGHPANIIVLTLTKTIHADQ